MTSYQILTIAFYGALALFAVIGTWGQEGKMRIGCVLFACWVLSNIIAHTLPVPARPAMFPLLDVLFALTCATAWLVTNSKPVPFTLIGLSVAAVLANLAFIYRLISISAAVRPQETDAYVITLNGIFALQCLVTGGWGIADAVGRVLGLHRLPRHHWGAAQSHRHRQENGTP